MYAEEQYVYYDTWQLQPSVAADPIQAVAPAQGQPVALTLVQPTTSIIALPTAAPQPQTSTATEEFFAAVDLMAQVEKVVEERPQTSNLEMLALVAVGFAQANGRIYGALVPSTSAGSS